MFECPCCRFKDSSIWKSSHWRRYCVYANFSEMEVFEPEILNELLKSGTGWFFKAPYWYQINRKHTIINRMLQMGYDEFKVHGFTEKPKKHRAGRQTTL